ncbi:MAG: hypothetical protein KBB84_00340 [Spirochaetes bacterium]|nr:hypothetical protein [Spirochaetota bacterium]
MSFFKSQKKQNLLLLDLFLILILLLFLSEIIMGEDAAISLKKIKKDFIKLDTNLISHEVYIKIDSIVSDYISIQFYIIGSYYLDFSRQEYIFLNSSSINFTFPIKFSSYKKYLLNEEQKGYIEGFIVSIPSDRFNMILEKENSEKFYFMMKGVSGDIVASLDSKVIKYISKEILSREETFENKIQTIRSPFNLFANLYIFNFYYVTPSSDPLYLTSIDNTFYSLFLLGNISAEFGINLNLPLFSSISIYLSELIIDDESPYIISTLQFGLRLYLLVFYEPDDFFIDFSVFTGAKVTNIFNQELFPLDRLWSFAYFVSLDYCFIATPRLNYIFSICFGDIEYRRLILFFQAALRLNF